MRVAFSEITPQRLSSALWRRVTDLPHRLAWAFAARAQNNKAHLLELKSRYQGERCYLMANGPSLAQTDLNALAGAYTFGMNRIYLLFDRIAFTPTFYAAINELVLQQFAHDIHGLDMTCFLNWNARGHYNNDASPTTIPHRLYVKPSLALHDFFSTDVTHPIATGGTVTFVALQLIYYMGFSEVVIIGLDHYFEDKGTPNQVQERQVEVDQNHFDPNYFPKGSRWQLPDLRRSELAYQLARAAFEADGRRILDATLNGHCTVFEKVGFETLL